MTEELLEEFRQEMRDGFAGVSGRLEQVDARLEQVDGRLEKVGERLEKLEGQVGSLEQSQASLKTQVAANETTLNHLDAEVHRQGLLLEERHDELKLGMETFQTAQRVTNAKIDLVRHAVENRLVPLELATRAHASTLADHGRRLDKAEGRAQPD